MRQDEALKSSYLLQTHHFAHHWQHLLASFGQVYAVAIHTYDRNPHWLELAESSRIARLVMVDSDCTVQMTQQKTLVCEWRQQIMHCSAGTYSVAIVLLSKQQRQRVVSILDLFFRAFLRAQSHFATVMRCCWRTRSLRCCQAHHWIEMAPVGRCSMSMPRRVLVWCGMRIIMLFHSLLGGTSMLGCVSRRSRRDRRRFNRGVMHRVPHLKVAHPPTGCHVLRTVRLCW